jgi:NADPH-dependent 2,4-dienoyl-CoA reductase/sulfur reductase-like enzyme
MTDSPDLVVIGAGPAGMAAAIEATAAGLDVTVLDENPAPGGQVWRGVEANLAAGRLLDEDHAAGAALVAAFRACGARDQPDATVWAIEPRDGGWEVLFTQAGVAGSLVTARILVATGATERALPLPGWTLPGVMSVGAAQILLKTAGMRPEGRVWLAGQGPLLRLYAVQLLKAGGRIAGILDVSPTPSVAIGLRDLPSIVAGMPQIAKGLDWGRTITRAGVPWSRVGEIAAHAGADGRLAEVAFRDEHGAHREPADLLLLHDGVVPNTQVTRALGLEHHYDPRQRCWAPRLDAFGRSSAPGILVAGDGGGILGAEAALISGRLAALASAVDLGRLDAREAAQRSTPLLRRRRAHVAVRVLLDRLYPPQPPPADAATIVCRCEEVDVAGIRAAASLGCLGLNQMKAFTRCGMGPCQGRLCGVTAAEVLAEARAVPPWQIEPFRGRFPIKPVTLGELASLAPP